MEASLFAAAEEASWSARACQSLSAALCGTSENLFWGRYLAAMASVLAVSQRERVGGKRSAALRRGLSACTAARRAATLWGKWELGGDEGHTGCVNRLRWSRSGGLLASVSDDLRLLLWRVDQVRRPSVVCDVETEHG